LWRCPLYV